MKTTKLVTLLLSFFSFYSFSQGVVSEPNQYESTWRNLQVVRNLLNNQDNSKPIDFKDIKGSPYDNPEFQKGEFFVDGVSQGQFLLRYNTYADEIEVIENKKLKDFNINKELEAFLRLDKSKAIIGKKIIEFYSYEEGKNINKGYFISLVDKKDYSILLRKRCILTPAQKAATFNEADRSAKFTTYNDFYKLEKSELRPKKITINKKNILKEYPSDKEKIKTYLRQHKIDFKNPADIIKIYTFLENLNN